MNAMKQLGAQEADRADTLSYSPECVEGFFSKIRALARVAFHSRPRIFTRYYNMQRRIVCFPTSGTAPALG
jgi:hypothetical protein